LNVQDVIQSIASGGLGTDENSYLRMVSVITSNQREPVVDDFLNGGIEHPLNQLFPESFTSNITSLAQWRNWETWQVTFADLQQITNIELLPLLSRTISIPPISAPLLADLSKSWIGNGFSVTQNDVLKTSLNDSTISESIFDQSIFIENHPSEIGLNKLTRFQRSLIESYSPEFTLFNTNASEGRVGNQTSTQVALNELDIFYPSLKKTPTHSVVDQLNILDENMIETGSKQIASTDSSIYQRLYKHTTTHPAIIEFGSISSQKRAIHCPIRDISPIQDNITQIGSTEIDVTPLNPSQIGTIQVGADKINISQFRPAQIDTSQIDTSKVSLPSLIPSQKLFSSDLSHTNTSLLTSIYSTAQSIWQVLDLSILNALWS
jgi:hypothetical protein